MALIWVKPFGVGGFSKSPQVRCLKLPLAPVFIMVPVITLYWQISKLSPELLPQRPLNHTEAEILVPAISF